MLQLLNEVSGAFQPGILTALVGVSGAGKTTLMDVLAGRKTRCAIFSVSSCSGKHLIASVPHANRAILMQESGSKQRKTSSYAAACNVPQEATQYA